MPHFVGYSVVCSERELSKCARNSKLLVSYFLRERRAFRSNGLNSFDDAIGIDPFEPKLLKNSTSRCRSFTANNYAREVQLRREKTIAKGCCPTVSHLNF